MSNEKVIYMTLTSITTTIDIKRNLVDFFISDSTFAESYSIHRFPSIEHHPILISTTSNYKNFQDTISFNAIVL